MREFFKPWRRRIGVCMLMLACVLMGGWFRSLEIQDTFTVGFGSWFQMKLISTNQRLIIATVSIEGDESILNHFWLSAPSVDGMWSLAFQFPDGLRGPTIFDGVTSEVYSMSTCEISSDNTRCQAVACQFSYWPILTPLVLLSALLLLIAPRKSTQTKIAEPLREMEV